MRDDIVIIPAPIYEGYKRLLGKRYDANKPTADFIELYMSAYDYKLYWSDGVMLARAVWPHGLGNAYEGRTRFFDYVTFGDAMGSKVLDYTLNLAEPETSRAPRRDFWRACDALISDINDYRVPGMPSKHYTGVCDKHFNPSYLCNVSRLLDTFNMERRRDKKAFARAVHVVMGKPNSAAYFHSMRDDLPAELDVCLMPIRR